MLHRLLGFIMLLVALAGIAVAIVGVRFGGEIIDNIGANLDATLDLSVDSLATVESSLQLTKSTVADVGTGLTTAQDVAGNVADTLLETRPMLEQIGVVASGDVPDSIEAIQAALPGVAEAAGAIDDTLTILNNFQINESIFGIRLQYDLGIDYEPDVPFEQSVTEIGASLDGVPENLRALDEFIGVADANLVVMARDLKRVADDLLLLEDNIGAIDPLLDEYIAVVVTANDSVRVAQASLQQDLARLRTGITIMLAWIALAQVAPLYIGWQLLWGRRLVAPADSPVAETAPEEAV